MRTALDPPDPEDFWVMWDAADERGKRALMAWVNGGGTPAPCLTGGS